MKTIKNVTVYKCEFCKKTLFRKHAMIRHEKFCESNPENSKACSGCMFLEEETIEHVRYNHYGSESITSSTSFKCVKKDILVYPTKVERLGLPEKYPETFEDQIPMPKECEDFDDGFSGLKDLFSFCTNI